jgi:hypothetical protein
MVEILEEIARNPKSYPTARISAIRALLELERKQEPDYPDPDSLFADLDTVPVRRSGHTGRAKH